MKAHAPSGSVWRRAILSLAALLILASASPARAESGSLKMPSSLQRYASPAQAEGDAVAFDWTELYAGGFAGVGLADNQIVDIDGFANWGRPGWSVDYDETGGVGGVLLGKRFDTGLIPLRIELDATFGSLSADTNRLDPKDLDETAESKFRWIATARAGLEHSVGPVTLFATGGLSVARIANAVTDIDFGPDMLTRKDPDDSFGAASTEIGWVIGVGIEAPLTEVWTLRLEGSYLDFGRSVHDVNRSANGRCGPGNPRRPCPYRVENTLGIIRLAIIRRFDW